MTPGPARWAKVLAAAIAVLLGVLAACGGGDPEDSPKPSSTRIRVVATTNILGDIARNVVGDLGDVEVLMPPNADPHSFEISAAQAESLLDADLVVANGLGLEEGVVEHLDDAKGQGVVVLEIGPRIDPIAYGVEVGEGEAGRPDPHFWTDPHRGARAAALIGEALGSAAPEGARRAIDENVERYVGELADTTGYLEELLGGIPAERRKLVTNHHVFGYLAERFDFEVVGAVIPSGSTLASPSAADLAELATLIRAEDVSAIFAESSQPTRLAKVLASEADIDVEVVTLFSESLTEPGEGASTYLEMIAENGRRIAAALAR